MTARKPKKSAPIVRKRGTNTIARQPASECTITPTVEVTDRNGRTRTLQASSIREAMRMEGDKG